MPSTTLSSKLHQPKVFPLLGLSSFVDYKRYAPAQFTGAGTLDGAGDLTAAGTLLYLGAGTLDGAGGLTAAGVVGYLASGSLAGAGDLSGSGFETFHDGGVAAGTGSLSAGGVAGYLASALLAGAGGLQVAGVPLGGAFLTGAGDLVAVGVLKYPRFHENFDRQGTLPPTVLDMGNNFKIDTGGHGSSYPNSVTEKGGGYHAILGNFVDSLSGSETVAVYWRPFNKGAFDQHVLMRSTRADWPSLNCYHASMSSNGLQIWKTIGGVTTALGAPTGVKNLQLPITDIYLLQGWVNLTALKACVVRASDGFFYANSGGWTASPTYWTASDASIPPASAYIGILTPGTTGSTYSDDVYMDPPVPVLDITAFTLLSLGAQQQLTPGGFTDPLFGVTWSSNNPAVATVDATGVVKAVSNGTAIITATGKRNTAETATSTVTVSFQIIYLAGAGGLQGTGGALYMAGGSLAGLGGLTAAGGVSYAVGASLAGVGDLTATANPPSTFGQVTLGGAGGLTAAGLVSYGAIINLAGIGDLLVNGKASMSGQATLGGSGDLTATGQTIPHYFSSGILDGHGGLLVGSPQTAYTASATLDGRGDLLTLGGASYVAAATLSGRGDLLGNGAPAFLGQVTLDGHGDLLSLGFGGFFAGATLDGHGDLYALGYNLTEASDSLHHAIKLKLVLNTSLVSLVGDHIYPVNPPQSWVPSRDGPALCYEVLDNAGQVCLDGADGTGIAHVNFVSWALLASEALAVIKTVREDWNGFSGPSGSFNFDYVSSEARESDFIESIEGSDKGVFTLTLSYELGHTP